MRTRILSISIGALFAAISFTAADAAPLGSKTLCLNGIGLCDHSSNNNNRNANRSGGNSGGEGGEGCGGGSESSSKGSNRKGKSGKNGSES